MPVSATVGTRQVMEVIHPGDHGSTFGGNPLAAVIAIAAMAELTHRNTRRYGGYLVHMGIVLMFIGFAGAAFNKDTTVEVEQGKSFQIGRYDLKVTGIDSGQTSNYVWQNATIEATVGGQPYAVLHPERRIYSQSQQPVGAVRQLTRTGQSRLQLKPPRPVTPSARP